MAKYVAWTKLKIQEFKYLVPMDHEQETVFDDMVNGKISIVQTARKLNVSTRTVDYIREWLWMMYDDVQPYSGILPKRNLPKHKRK